MSLVGDLWKNYPRRVIAVIAILFFICCAYFDFTKKQSAMLVTFLDVGQGDAVLITAPNGNRLLYDAGPPTHAILPRLSEELSYFDRNISVFVASHPDADHIGGFLDVFARYTPRLYFDGHTPTVSSDFVATEDLLKQKGIERMTVTQGTQISLGEGVLIDVLAPRQGEYKESLSTNDASVVLLVHYGSSTVFLSGDMESKEEENLVRQYGLSIHSTILKAGHHGSKSSTSDALLHATHPKYVAISVGAKNRYGHPHAAALSRMQTIGATIVQTSLRGSIHFSCTLRDCALLK